MKNLFNDFYITYFNNKLAKVLAFYIYKKYKGMKKQILEGKTRIAY